MIINRKFRDYIIDKYTSILEENGYTGVIYKQEDGNPSNRILWKIVSPGTSFSSNESINKYTNNACCIWLHNIKNNFIGNKLIIGISMIDVYTGKTIITEYSNFFYHNPTTYDELEYFTSIYNPVESIIIHNLKKTIQKSVNTSVEIFFNYLFYKSANTD